MTLTRSNRSLAASMNASEPSPWNSLHTEMPLALQHPAGEVQRQFRQVHRFRLIHRLGAADIGRHIAHYKVHAVVADRCEQRLERGILGEVALDEFDGSAARPSAAGRRDDAAPCVFQFFGDVLAPAARAPHRGRRRPCPASEASFLGRSARACKRRANASRRGGPAARTDPVPGVRASCRRCASDRSFRSHCVAAGIAASAQLLHGADEL